MLSYGKAILVVSVLAVAGTAFITLSGAAPFTVSSEIENGAITGNAARVSLPAAAGASGDSSIKFGTAAATCGQAGIQQLVNNVSATNIEANLRTLVQDDTKQKPNQSVTRYVGTAGNTAKVSWMKQQLSGYGLQLVDQSFTSGGRNLSNVVGRLAGSNGSSLYATGAHIDSISTQSSTLAPGADDNAAGVAAVMEAARVMKPFQPCLKSSVDFIGFNDEEVNMNGSKTYVSRLGSTSFKGLFNLDMIGYQPDGVECIDNYYKSASREQQLAQRLQTVNGKYGVNLAMTMGQYSYDDVDSVSFWDANLPSLYESECIDSGSDNPGYHKTTDTIDLVNIQQVTRLTKVIVAGMAELAAE